jgi:hypothetical protein
MLGVSKAAACESIPPVAERLAVDVPVARLIRLRRGEDDEATLRCSVINKTVFQRFGNVLSNLNREYKIKWSKLGAETLTAAIER